MWHTITLRWTTVPHGAAVAFFWWWQVAALHIPVYSKTFNMLALWFIYGKKKLEVLVTENLLHDAAFSFIACSLTEDTAVKQWSCGRQRSTYLLLPLLCSVTHTGLTTHTQTDALTDTIGCLPTSPITGLFIRDSYRQYWQPADM